MSSEGQSTPIPPVLVTGSMRSGTTFLGEVLRRHYALTYLHEPFHRKRGIEGVDHWFPYAAHEADEYATLVDRFVELDFTYRDVQTGSRWKDLLRSVLGGRPTWYATYFRLIGQRHSMMLVKDPLAAFLSAYLHRRHGFSVVVLLRHPAAFYYSNKRLGWDFDFSHFLSQSSLIDRHLSDEVQLMERSGLTYPDRMALLWRCIYKVLLDFERDAGSESRWHVRYHEDLCRNPKQEVVGLLDRLGIEPSARAMSFLRRATSGANPVEAPESEPHEFSRDSRRLADYWKRRLASDEILTVRRMAGEVAAEFYDDGTWTT